MLNAKELKESGSKAINTTPGNKGAITWET
ncbi:hypothetical protein RDI58_024143 [Solanum bulbocastanum]|uniref:Uncharacterized protein n=1 Tax=Solanum bulbocastanum TaxID=147425 RepID=A0AAN8T596_SOLBU